MVDAIGYIGKAKGRADREGQDLSSMVKNGRALDSLVACLHDIVSIAHLVPA